MSRRSRPHRACTSVTSRATALGSEADSFAVKVQVSGQGRVRICSAPRSIQCPRQDSNLRSRLRRGLLCRPLTRGNDFPHAMIGGVSGAARRTWAGGHAERGGAPAGLPDQRLVRVRRFDRQCGPAWPASGRARRGRRPLLGGGGSSSARPRWRRASAVIEAAGRTRREDDLAAAAREPIAAADRPRCRDDHDAMAWPAGPVVAGHGRPCPGERFMRRAPGRNAPGSALRTNRAHFRRGRCPPGVPRRAAKPPMQAPPAG